MSARLTEKQERLMRFIQRHVACYGRSPTFDIMAEAMAVSSKSNVARYLAGLTRAGFIARPRKYGHGLIILKTLPDDRFTSAARRAFDAAGLPYSDAQLKAGRSAMIDALVIDATEEAAA